MRVRITRVTFCVDHAAMHDNKNCSHAASLNPMCCRSPCLAIRTPTTDNNGIERYNHATVQRIEKCFLSSNIKNSYPNPPCHVAL